MLSRLYVWRAEVKQSVTTTYQTRPDGVTQFTIGQPFPTNAVVEPTNGPSDPFKDTVLGPLKMLPIGEKLSFTFNLSPEDVVVGLGQTMGGVNKNGRRYRMFSKDQCGYTPDKEGLHGSHPFFIVLSEDKAWGVFIDYPGEIIVDLGYTSPRTGLVEVMGLNCEIYLIEGKDLFSITKRFLKLIGMPTLPPRWAFGFHQCRYSYMTSDEVREIAQNYRKLGIPCDAIYLDIDYMDRYKVFTCDPDRFADVPELVKELDGQGFRLVPILDPAVKVEQGYDIYESGLKANVFCLDEKGEPFIAMVWPGYACLPDFLNAKACEWWKKHIRSWTDIGVTAFWNDMNEPAIYATRAGLRKLKDGVSEIPEEKDPGPALLDHMLAPGRLLHNESYYDEFYHTTDCGERVKHRLVHNLYGNCMANATADALNAIEENTRHLVISRSSYIGTHRKAVLWTGDNSSNWEDLAYHVRMLASCNLVGMFFIGADIGGFCCNVTPELLIRWHQAGVLSPLFRNHSQIGTRRQEPWTFDDETQGYIREAILLRYALLPHFYSQYLTAITVGEPFIRPVLAHYKTTESRDIDSQVLLGRNLLGAPVIQPGAHGRFVHLPEHPWLRWSAHSWRSRECEVMQPGNYHINVERGELPLFIALDSCVVLREPEQHEGEKPLDRLIVLGFVSNGFDHDVLRDDGVTNDYQLGKIGKVRIEVRVEGGKVKVSAAITEYAEYWKELREIVFEMYDLEGRMHLSAVDIRK